METNSPHTLKAGHAEEEGEQSDQDRASIPN